MAWPQLPPLLALLRPAHWTKNVFILSPLLVTSVVTQEDIRSAAIAFAIFCLAASAVYVWNDLCDKERDRLHPLKQHRPIASGRVSPQTAWILLVALTGATAILTSAFLREITLPLVGYVALNIAYSLF